MDKLKPCPFCGGEANVERAVCDYDAWHVVCPNNNCRAEAGCCGSKDGAADAWNTRTPPANPPLTLDELREMDGEPVWVQAGSGEEGYAIAAIDGDSMFLHGPDIEAYYEPDIDFYMMEYNLDPDGHFGLHVLGWRCYRHKPESEETHD